MRGTHRCIQRCRREVRCEVGNGPAGNGPARNGPASNVGIGVHHGASEGSVDRRSGRPHAATLERLHGSPPRQMGMCELLAAASLLIIQPPLTSDAAQAATLSSNCQDSDSYTLQPGVRSQHTSQLVTAPSPEVGPTAELSTLGRTLKAQQTEALLPIPTKFPPLPDVKLPEYKRVVLDNGLRVFLIEDHEVPVVKGTMIIKGGQYASPRDKLGLATITAAVQRSGGTQQHPADELDARLEDLDAGIEAGAAAYATNINFDCLVEDTDEVMGLFAEVVRTPAFPAPKLDFMKQQVLNILDHAYDNPPEVGRRMLQQLMWGKDSIYARQATKTQVRAIQVEDLQSYVSNFERPDMAVLGIVGDFNSEQMIQRVEELFGDWPVPESPKFVKDVEVFPPQDDIAGKVFLVDRPGLTQASVVSAEPGVELNDPDAGVLDVMGQIYGSFGGQLFNQIRTREGLAYSISGGWDTPPEHDGMFLTASATSSPAELLVGLRRVLESSRNEVVSESELARARSKSLNSFIFNFVSSSSQLSRIIAYELLNIPQDFPFKYQKSIESVNQQRVLEAARKHLHPDKQTTVVVADAKTAKPALEAAGFDVVPLTLPSLE